jgi:hypothetical protein
MASSRKAVEPVLFSGLVSMSKSNFPIVLPALLELASGFRRISLNEDDAYDAYDPRSFNMLHNFPVNCAGVDRPGGGDRHIRPVRELEHHDSTVKSSQLEYKLCTTLKYQKFEGIWLPVEICL